MLREKGFDICLIDTFYGPQFISLYALSLGYFCLFVFLMMPVSICVFDLNTTGEDILSYFYGIIANT